MVNKIVIFGSLITKGLKSVPKNEEFLNKINKILDLLHQKYLYLHTHTMLDQSKIALLKTTTDLDSHKIKLFNGTNTIKAENVAKSIGVLFQKI